MNQLETIIFTFAFYAFLCWSVFRFPQVYLAIWVLWIGSSYSTWKSYFKDRVDRMNAASPSYTGKPAVVAFSNILSSTSQTFSRTSKAASKFLSSIQENRAIKAMTPSGTIDFVLRKLAVKTEVHNVNRESKLKRGLSGYGWKVHHNAESSIKEEEEQVTPSTSAGEDHSMNMIEPMISTKEDEHASNPTADSKTAGKDDSMEMTPGTDDGQDDSTSRAMSPGWVDGEDTRSSNSPGCDSGEVMRFNSPGWVDGENDSMSRVKSPGDVAFLSKTKSPHANELEMNHIRLSLGQYLWGAHFVAIPSMLALVYGECKLRVMRLMNRLGMLKKPSDEELSFLTGHMLLESSCTINFSHTYAASHGDDEIAVFVWPSIPLIIDTDTLCESRVSVVRVEINLSTKKVVSAIATIQNKKVVLTMSDVFMVVSHIICAFNHPKIHAYANWGIDPQEYEGQENVNPYYRKMSIVTTLYNHFGCHNAPKIYGFLVNEGAGNAFADTVQHAMQVPTPAHSAIRTLMPHSRTVSFIARLRGPWFHIFEKHVPEFPSNISAESHFLGTVMHSLEHSLYCRHLPERELVACTPSPMFASKKKIQEITRFGLTEDLPSIMFARSFKHAPMQFYNEVYARACTLDADYAGLMQTCIVK